MYKERPMSSDDRCLYCGAAMIYDEDGFGRGFMRCEIDCQFDIENDPGFWDLMEAYADDDFEEESDDR